MDIQLILNSQKVSVEMAKKKSFVLPLLTKWDKGLRVGWELLEIILASAEMEIAIVKPKS